MKYMGSKSRISKHILPIMLREADKYGINTWVEPFVGGGNMIDKVPGTFKRIGIDINAHAIEALIAIRDLVDILPNSITQEEYNKLKGADPDPIKSWLRFVCSFGGKFDNGYARQGNPLKYGSEPIEEGFRNAQKQSPKLQGVKLVHGSYDEYSDLQNCIIYCDPPYKNTTSYKTDTFDHNKFYDWCRSIGRRNLVFVSEYNAPVDFSCLWSGKVKTNFASTRTTSTHIAVEKLFKYTEQHEQNNS